MKYVMFTHKPSGMRYPVFMAGHISHSDVKLDDKNFEATSAGEFDVETGRCVGQSSSLRMKPAHGDDVICHLVVSNLESMMIMAQDIVDNSR